MGRTGAGHLFPAGKLVSKQGALKTQRDSVKAVTRHQGGWFSLNNVNSSEAKISQHKNEKMTKCFQLFNHHLSWPSCVLGHFPGKGHFLQNLLKSRVSVLEKKQSAALQVPGWCAAFTK